MNFIQFTVENGPINIPLNAKDLFLSNATTYGTCLSSIAGETKYLKSGDQSILKGWFLGTRLLLICKEILIEWRQSQLAQL